MKKSKAGLSLIELIIAMALISIAFGGLMTFFVVGLNMSRHGQRLDMANIEAQVQMEQLIGRYWHNDLRDLPHWGEIIPAYNGFNMRRTAELWRGTLPEGHDLFYPPNPLSGLVLVRLVVEIFDGDTLIVRHDVILNVNGRENII